ncbi:MAG: sulfatase-like hydrolase/transferase, partial [Bryobacterales bacterium]|nr:sulfatase-like hydrolase/transferase [Bryobacterales bacterium]
GAFGKWHNGSQGPYHPNARGFREYYGFTSGHWAHYFNTEMDHNGRFTRGNGFIIDDLTDHALRFIEQNRSNPFFCYLPVNTPHSPMQVPERFYSKFANFQPRLQATDPKLEELTMTRAALAMVENIDWNVGRVLSKLKELKLESNTIVLYFCDNGPNSWRWNGGMKGRKGTLDEGGLRSPLLIRYPGRIPEGRTVAPIAGAIDLLPTLTSLAGIPVTSTKPLDGRDLSPLLFDNKPAWPDRTLFSLHNRRVSVRTEQYRLDPDGRLFDMLADPGQTQDVSPERAEVAARLTKAAAEWGREVLPLVGPDDRPYPVGYTPFTYLPARDGESSGSIQRSTRAPNSSYFTNWTSTNDRITWDIDVLQPGEYEATLHYTSPTAGSVIELSFGDARLEARIAEAHDPPLYGMNEDRHKRAGESYAKNFRPLILGNINLKTGRGKLTLRALQIAGAQVADVRYLTLTRREETTSPRRPGRRI